MGLALEFMLALVWSCHTSSFKSLMMMLSRVSFLGGRESRVMMKVAKDSGTPLVSARIMSLSIVETPVGLSWNVAFFDVRNP